MTLGTILLIILILILIGALPNWGYSRDWGYYPSGGIGLVCDYHPHISFDGQNITLWNGDGRPRHLKSELNQDLLAFIKKTGWRWNLFGHGTVSYI